MLDQLGFGEYFTINNFLVEEGYKMLNIEEHYITNTQNFTRGRGRKSIKGIVLHTEAPSTKIENSADRSLFDWFNNNNRQVSAHYYVTFSGKIEQYVLDQDTAHHAGAWNSNRITIGIEHQDNGFFRPNNARYTDAQYEASAQLVATLCVMYDIPAASPIPANPDTGINIHKHVIGASTNCPNALDTQRIIDRAAAIIAANDPQFLLQVIQRFRDVLADVTS